MTIIFHIDDFLFELFPVEKNNLEQLKDFLKRFYAEGSFEPKIEIQDGFVKINIDTSRISEDKASYQKLTNLCEKGQFAKAKSLAKELIEKTPNISEYFRILGQILSDEGNQKEAINNLIDALRWNPKNEWALIMMGNIFAKFENDIDTALTYYNQVLTLTPDNYIALYNIGANLMQVGKTEEALKYFEKAISINPDYPNTHHALGLNCKMRKDYEGAFKNALNAIKLNSSKDELYDKSLRLAIEASQKLIQNTNGEKIVKDFATKLEEKCAKEIRIKIDENIPTAAKIEFAENYKRDYHLVLYKSSYPAVEHLIMHELMHLELTTEAREINENKLFTTHQLLKSNFIFSLQKFADKLINKGVPKEAVDKYMQSLFDGLNSQIFNTPIDLFIEDRIYNNYPEFRPFQFLSLLALIQEGIEATTNPEIIKSSPPEILSKSKIFNLINAMHLKELFEADLLNDHKPTKAELNQANRLYNEFKEYRNDKAPGEEYELVQHWAEDLELNSFFEIVPENEPKQRTIENVLSEIESDPYGLDTKDSSKERKMKEFMDEHGEKELNLAVTMYMVGALNYFNPMSKSQVKELAFEFATLGMSGINPEKDGYYVPSIKNKTFSGYKALAYYYVSWAIYDPKVLAEIQMPFDKEYKMAEKLIEL